MCEAQKTTQDDIRVWGSDSSLNPSEAPPTTPIKPRRRPPATFMRKQKSAPDLTTPSVWGIVQAVQKIQADDDSSIYSEIFGKSVVPDFRAPTPHTEPKKKLVVHQTAGRVSETLNQVPTTLDMSVTSKTNSEGYSQVLSKAEQERIRDTLQSPIDDGDAISEITSSIRSSKKTKRSSGKRSSRMLKKASSLPDLFTDQEKEWRSFTDLTLCSNGPGTKKLSKSTSDRSLGSKKSLRSRSKNRLRKSSSDRSLSSKRSSRSPSKNKLKKSSSDRSLTSKKLSRSHSKNKLKKSSSDRSLGSRRSSRSPSKTKLKKSTSPSGKRSSLRSSKNKLKKSKSDNCLSTSKKSSKRKGLKKVNSSPSLINDEKKAKNGSSERSRSKSATRKRRTKKPRSKSTSMLDPTTCTEAAMLDPTFHAEAEALKAEFEDRLREAELKLEAEMRSNSSTPAAPQRKQGAHEEERIRVFAESMRRSQSLSPSKYKLGAVDGSRVVVTNDRRFKNRWSKVQPTPPSMPTMQRRWSTAGRGRPPAISVL